MHRKRINWSTISETDFKSKFRFHKADFPRLLRNINLPSIVRLKNRTIVSGEEVLLIVLNRLAYPVRLETLVETFGISKSNISLAFNYGINFIYENFSHLLNFEAISSLKLESYAQAVLHKGCPLNNCAGFIDGTLRPSSRPSRNQKTYYNGHKRCHGLKFQGIVYPDGIIAHLSKSFSGNRHDSGILKDSGILDILEESFKGIGGRRMCIYGDQAYPILPFLLRPFHGANLNALQFRFNRVMSLSRISVEWSFGKVIKIFAFLDFKKNLKLLLQPVDRIYIVGALLTNCHTCFYNSQVSMYFNCQPPLIEDYLQQRQS